MKVKISDDFRNLFRPLTDAEREQAKSNNLADPNHDRVPPIAIWNGTVIDGHHTLKIRENLRVNGKPVKIRYCEMEFIDRAAAMAYAIQAQLGRRNLDPSQIAIALAKLPKNTHGGDREQGANLHLAREAMAEEHGISERTLKSADKVVEHGAKAVVAAIASGDVTVSDAASIADLPKSEQVAALKKVLSGDARTLKSASGEDDDSGTKPKETNNRPPRSGREKPVVSKDYGKCPNCGHTKWAEDEFGVTCSKCNHPHGEARGDPDKKGQESKAERLKTQRAKWIKTIEADIRAADDTHDYWKEFVGKDSRCSKQAAKHEEAVRLLKQVLHIAKEWPT